MKKTIILAVLIVFCIGLTSYSQFSVGPRFGLNLNYYDFNYNDTVLVLNAKLKPAPQFGIMFANKFNDQIRLRASIIHSFKGSSLNTKYTQIILGGTIVKTNRTEKITISYIEIPVEGAFGFMVGEVYVFSNIGAYFAATFGGKSKYELEYSYEYTDGTINNETYDGDYRIYVKGNEDIWSDSYSWIKPIDYGLNFGIGFKIMYIMFNAQYGLGLCNISPNTTVNEDYQTNHKTYNRGISFYLAFLFGDKEKKAPK